MKVGARFCNLSWDGPCRHSPSGSHWCMLARPHGEDHECRCGATQAVLPGWWPRQGATPVKPESPASDVEYDCGHDCCDDRSDPYHDHFLTADICGQCVRMSNGSVFDEMVARVRGDSPSPSADWVLDVCLSKMDALEADRDRLSEIVDLACAEHEAGEASEVRYECNHGWSKYHAARVALTEAVAVEVERRAAL